MLIKDEVVVLKVDEFMESSSIVTALSKSSGLLKLMAKGAQRVKSQLRMAFQLFSRSELIYYYKPDREFNILKEGKILEAFDEIPRDYEKFYLISYIAAYIIKNVPQEAGENIYLDVLNLIRFVNTSSTLNENLYNFFVLRNQMRQGEFPSFDYCARCKSRDLEYFIPSQKTVVCGRCARPDELKVPVDQGTSSEIRFILHKSWQEVNSLALRENTRRLLETFIT